MRDFRTVGLHRGRQLKVWRIPTSFGRHFGALCCRSYSLVVESHQRGTDYEKKDVYVAIEVKYGFAIPAEYRRMEAEGFFDVKRSKRIGCDMYEA